MPKSRPVTTAPRITQRKISPSAVTGLVCITLLETDQLAELVEREHAVVHGGGGLGLLQLREDLGDSLRGGVQRREWADDQVEAEFLQLRASEVWCDAALDHVRDERWGQLRGDVLELLG